MMMFASNGVIVAPCYSRCPDMRAPIKSSTLSNRPLLQELKQVHIPTCCSYLSNGRALALTMPWCARLVVQAGTLVKEGSGQHACAPPLQQQIEGCRRRAQCPCLCVLLGVALLTGDLSPLLPWNETCLHHPSLLVRTSRPATQAHRQAGAVLMLPHAPQTLPLLLILQQSTVPAP
jgi:hypothetical protein